MSLQIIGFEAICPDRAGGLGCDWTCCDRIRIDTSKGSLFDRCHLKFCSVECHSFSSGSLIIIHFPFLTGPSCIRYPLSFNHVVSRMIVRLETPRDTAISDNDAFCFKSLIISFSLGFYFSSCLSLVTFLVSASTPSRCFGPCPRVSSIISVLEDIIKVKSNMSGQAF